MVNMGVQYMIVIVLSITLGWGFLKNGGVEKIGGGGGGGLGGIGDGLAILCSFFSSFVCLPILLFIAYTLVSCQYYSPGLWMIAMIIAGIAAMNIPTLYTYSNIYLYIIPIAIVLQIIGLVLIPCNKKIVQI